jgi:hypothetical protein
MLGEFHVVSKRYVPLWRQRRRKRQVATEVTMAIASLAGLVLVWAPWRETEHLNGAISFQVAAGDPVAVALFAFMGLVLIAMAHRLYIAQRRASAIFMGLQAAALAYLAFSDPLSIDHLLTFIAVALTSTAWLVTLAFDLEDGWLGIAAACSVAGLFVVFANMGIGERSLITSSLLGMNVMFFRHFG